MKLTVIDDLKQGLPVVMLRVSNLSATLRVRLPFCFFSHPPLFLIHSLTPFLFSPF
jgi:hypothetical protein